MIKKGPVRTWSITILLLAASGILLYAGIRQRREWKKSHVFIELRAFQTPKGWGYDILTDGKVYIHQDEIPAIPGGKPFLTKEDALLVGQKVYERAVSGQTPMVTAKEVRDMGIGADSADNGTGDRPAKAGAVAR